MGELDKHFLEWNENPEEKQSELEYALLMVGGWLIGNAGKRFSLYELENELDISHYFMCMALSHPSITELFVYDPHDSFAYKEYMSTAPMPLPSDAGREEMRIRSEITQDPLGGQARDEFRRRQHDPNLFRHHKSQKITRRF